MRRGAGESSGRLEETRLLPAQPTASIWAMSHPLLDRELIGDNPETYLAGIGDVFAVFGARTQDSGNISYGIRIGDDRYFVKTAGDPDDPKPYLDHPARVALLRNAALIAARIVHPNLSALRQVIESPTGPLLVYRWADGDLLHDRAGPDSAAARFTRLPVNTICAVLDSIYGLHELLAVDGWVAVDFYDGCLIYDFAADRVSVIDLDTYHRGPFTNEMGRMFGSSRFMAPEEFELGATIDERTTVFTMGRTALLYLCAGSLDPAAFRGPRRLFDVAVRACNPQPDKRFGTVADFAAAWRAGRSL